MTYKIFLETYPLKFFELVRKIDLETANSLHTFFEEIILSLKNNQLSINCSEQFTNSDIEASDLFFGDMKTFSIGISKIKNWQQVISTIAICAVAEISAVLKPESALDSTSIGLALVLLMFYIVKRSTVLSNSEETFTMIRRARLEGYIDAISGADYHYNEREKNVLELYKTGKNTRSYQ